MSGWELEAPVGTADVSFWLDDLSRERLSTGNLQALIDEYDIKGVTTNPTIFAKALLDEESYASSIEELSGTNCTPQEAVETLMCEDVQRACDVFAPVFAASGGYDGFVSIEVSPAHAHNAQETVVEATRLWQRINRPNLLVKVPGTLAGLESFSALIAQGISVNVTLLFSLERYRAVTNAYLSGLEMARQHGHDLRSIHSVASFFVSRLDTAVDAQLRRIDSDDARAAQGLTAVANAQSAYEIFVQQFSSERARFLLSCGANLQRPLWASTGMKDPSLPDTLYVDALLAPYVVNTMPEETLRAVHDHGLRTGDTIGPQRHRARQILDRLSQLGVDYDSLVITLEQEGIEKFSDSFDELTREVERQLRAARG